MKTNQPIRLAPLVPEAEIVSAIAKQIVDDYAEDHAFETMSDTDVQTVALLNCARAS